MVSNFPDFMSGHSETLAVLHNLSVSCRPHFRTAGRDKPEQDNVVVQSEDILRACLNTRAMDKTERRKWVGNICGALLVLLSAFFKVPLQELRSAQRGKSNIARIRQLGMYIAHTMFGLSMAEVAYAFSRERTTVKHACHLIEDMRDDEAFDRNVSSFEYLIRIIYADGGVANER